MNKRFLLLGGTLLALLLTTVGIIFWLRSRDVDGDENRVTQSPPVQNPVIQNVVKTGSPDITKYEKVRYNPAPGSQDPFTRHESPEAAVGDEDDTIKPLNETAQISEALKDSDGDTILNGEERFFGTDPLKADTDGDGFSDADEIKNGYNPLGPGQCTVKNCVINQ